MGRTGVGAGSTDMLQSEGGQPHAAVRSAGGELGHRLGALRHRVFGQLAGEDEAHRGLDLARGDGGLLVVASQVGGLDGDLVKDVLQGAPEVDAGLNAASAAGARDNPGAERCAAANRAATGWGLRGGSRSAGHSR